MYNSALKNILNIDISDVVINKMKENYKDKFTEMKCKCQLKLVEEMDATQMTFAENSFDFVFDKGTLDALMVFHIFIFSAIKHLRLHPN